jgi:hypothetical protein
MKFLEHSAFGQYLGLIILKLLYGGCLIRLKTPGLNVDPLTHLESLLALLEVLGLQLGI